MKRVLTTLTALAVPALAGHDENPSPKVASYTYNLEQLNMSGVTGTVRIKALPNNKAQIKVRADGLTPNQVHAQHLHGDLTAASTDCPPAEVGNVIPFTTVDGIPFYGPDILVSLTTSGSYGPGDALAVDRFPVADENGHLEYNRTIKVSDAVYALLGKVQYVTHGIDLDGSGAYDGEARSSIDPTIPLEITIAAACGGIEN